MTEHAAKKGLTILITTFNASSMIEETLKRLIEMEKVPGLDWEVLIVDNNSTDDTVEKARKFWDNQVELRIINEPQQGTGFAKFKGMSEAKFEFIGIIDQDNWVHSDWMVKAVQYLEQDASAAIICARGYPVFETKKPDWFDRYQANFAVGPQSEKTGATEDLQRFFYNAGCIMRKSAFEEALKVGFVPIMRSRTSNNLLSGEDTELQIIFKLLGWEIHYQDMLRFDHFMPKKRLSVNYFRRLREGMGATSVYLSIYRETMDAFFEGRQRTRINWRQELKKSFKSVIQDPLAALASLFPEKFASNHRVASFWSNLGNFKTRRFLKSDFERTQIELESWLDSWLEKTPLNKHQE